MIYIISLISLHSHLLIPLLETCPRNSWQKEEKTSTQHDHCRTICPPPKAGNNQSSGINDKGDWCSSEEEEDRYGPGRWGARIHIYLLISIPRMMEGGSYCLMGTEFQFKDGKILETDGGDRWTTM